MKHMSEEERTLITISCEPFFLHYKKNNLVKDVFEELSEYTDCKSSKEVWTVVTALCQSYAKGMNGSLFPLNKNSYIKDNKTNPQGISYRKCIRVLNSLEENGYIEVYKGFYDHFKSVSVLSCIRPTSKLDSLFEGKVLKHTITQISDYLLVELRDSKSGELVTSTEKLRGIQGKRSLVKNMNKVLSSYDIRCKSVPVSASYKKVFTDSFELHGRWYSFGGLQTSRSYLRKYITINGVKTTEVDFKQMHPRLLMCLEGTYEGMDYDPYGDLSEILKCDKDTARKFSKLALMCLINAESLSKAKSAIFKKYKDDVSSGGDSTFRNIKMEKGTVNKVVDRLCELNKSISHYFGTPKLWAKLQYLDSQIASYIIERFVTLGKCILPWHDSFVVSVHDRDLLIDTMREGWEFVMGTRKNCFYDIEF